MTLLTSHALCITGIGAVSAAGIGVAALKERVLSGGTALVEWAPWVVPGSSQALDPGWLGRVPGIDARAMSVEADGVPQALCVEWGTLAVREALTDAGVIGRVPARRIGLLVGTNLEDTPAVMSELVDRIARAVGIEGPRVAVSVACASATACFPLARDLFAAGGVDAVVVGGCDVLTPRVIAGFRLLKLVAAGPCAPFSAQLGTSLGEGAGFVVLEPREGGEEVLLGEALATDGYHATTPEPQGRGTAAVIEASLRAAGLSGAEVEVINAHATGTLANDDAEVRGIRRALGERADAVPVSASKSVLGHAQGAAGGLELVVALLARRAAVVPPTVNFVMPARTLAPRDPVAGDVPRARAHDVVLSLSAGFGGANAAVVVGRGRGARAEAGRRVRIAGACALTAAGVRAGSLTREDVAAVIGRRVDAIDWRALVRGVDLRRKHPGTRFLTAAVAHALGRDARGGADVGLIVGQQRVSPAAIARIHDQIGEHGLLNATATAFAESLAVNAAGDCAAGNELLGPFNVLCGGEAAGLLALVHAAGLLRRDPAVRRMVAAAVDEADARTVDATPFEGGAAIVVGDEGAWELAGVAVTGPGMGDEAVSLALVRAGLGRGSLDGVMRVAGAGWDGPALVVPARGACGGLLAVMRGFNEFSRAFAVVVEDPRVGCCAVVLAP